MSGFVCVDRGVFSHPLFAHEKYSRAQAWLWLVAEAAWKQRRLELKGRMITLERGQVCCSVRFMAQKWRWSKSVVQRYIVRLQAEVMVEVDSSPGQLVITICNYEKFQNIGGYGKARARVAAENVPEAGDGTARGHKRAKQETRIKPKTICERTGLTWREVRLRLVSAAGRALAGDARGLENAAVPFGWLASGCDLTRDILPVIAARSANRAPGQVRSWSYYTRAVETAFTRRGGRPLEAVRPPGSLTRADWRRQVRLFTKRPDLWDRPTTRDYFGPPPGERGCRVPASVLAEFGLGEPEKSKRKRQKTPAGI